MANKQTCAICAMRLAEEEDAHRYRHVRTKHKHSLLLDPETGKYYRHYHPLEGWQEPDLDFSSVLIEICATR